MTLTRVFQTSLCALVSLAAVMLAYGEESFFPSGLTVPLACLVLYLHERQFRLWMRGWVGNLLGLAALFVAGLEFSGARPDAKLLGCAHFLVYITWIVLMQEKGIRQYWWLCALSLLQVAVGSVMASETGSYGMLLLAYLPLALWTLSVFTLYQGASALGGLDDEGPSGGRGPSAAGDVPGGAAVPPPAVDPLKLVRQSFAADSASTVRHAIQQDTPGRWIVPRFVFGVLGLTVAGLALGLVLFLFVPRVSFGSGFRIRSEPSRGKTITGFSGEVRLGQIGQILENIDRVMLVKLYERVDGVNDRPYSLEAFTAEFGLSAPLFRGSVLDDYRDGRWRGAAPGSAQTQVMQSHPLEPGMIRQEYTLELSGAEFLFAMRPINRARLYNPRGAITCAYDSGAFAGPSERREPVEYLVYSSRRTSQERSAGRNEFGTLPGNRQLNRVGAAMYLQLPTEGLGGLVRLAHELTATTKLVGSDEVSRERRIAQILEAHLRDSDEYRYTLNMEVDDPNRDPVEEFLLVRKRGHCEYFASALALMLRAVKIPSRLVTGFKGAEFHESDGSYEVQQRHAHVWVEAWVDDEWIVLDPTPGARDDVVRQVAENAGFWKNAKNSISSLWSTYVVSLSLNRQQQSLYDPLSGKVAGGWTSIRGVLQQVVTGVEWVKILLRSPGQFFSRSGAIAGLVAIVALLALARLARRGFRGFFRRPTEGGRGGISRLIGWIMARLTGRRPDPARVVVAFYQQFLELVGAAGFIRRDEQTQREFAQDVERALGERLAVAGLGQFPTQLAELFYRVRFGDGALETTEVSDVETRLAHLAASLSTNGRGRASRRA